MIQSGEHFGFIAGSYLGVTVLVLALIVWVVLDNRRVKARLKALEAQGIRRRSESDTK